MKAVTVEHVYSTITDAVESNFMLSGLQRFTELKGDPVLGRALRLHTSVVIGRAFLGYEADRYARAETGFGEYVKRNWPAYLLNLISEGDSALFSGGISGTSFQRQLAASNAQTAYVKVARLLPDEEPGQNLFIFLVRYTLQVADFLGAAANRVTSLATTTRSSVPAEPLYFSTN